MSRISQISNDAANDEQRALFEAITSELGMVPNFLRVLAHSPTALNAFLGLHTIATKGELDSQTRERIALAVAQQNECDYCVAAHTAIGRKSGLDNEEMVSNRRGSSSDAKAAVAVRFAKLVAEHAGEVTHAEVAQVRDAGYSDAEIVEIITHVGMNTLTNMIGKASEVDIDFPKVELALAS